MKVSLPCLFQHMGRFYFSYTRLVRFSFFFRFYPSPPLRLHKNGSVFRGKEALGTEAPLENATVVETAAPAVPEVCWVYWHVRYSFLYIFIILTVDRHAPPPPPRFFFGLMIERSIFKHLVFFAVCVPFRFFLLFFFYIQ